MNNSTTQLGASDTASRSDIATFSPGTTLKQILLAHGIPETHHHALEVLVDGVQVLDMNYQPMPNQEVRIVVLGKKGVKAVIGIALIATGIGFAAGGLSGIMAGTGGFWASMAVSTGLSMLAGALFAPKMPDMDAGIVKSNPYFTGQSNANPNFQPVIMSYGKFRIAPVLASKPLVVQGGEVSTITNLYDWGLGDYAVYDIKVGDVNLSEYKVDGQEWYRTNNPTLKYLTGTPGYDTYQRKLNQNESFTAVTKNNANKAFLDISFQRGLFNYVDNKAKETEAEFAIDFKLQSASTWTPANASLVLSDGITASQGTGSVIITPAVTHYETQTYETESGSQTQTVEVIDVPAVYASTGTIKFKGANTSAVTALVEIKLPAAGKYDIRIKRVSAITQTATKQDCAWLTKLTSIQDMQPVVTKSPHTYLELKLTATDQLSGNLNNITGIASRKVRTHNGTTWGPYIETSNPAWIALDMLTSSALARPIDTSKIDLQSFIALANKCDEVVDGSPRHTFNGVIQRSTLKQAVNGVLAMCYATLTVKDGRWGVIYDTATKSYPKQLLTPSNSWSFSGTIALVPVLHAFKVKFVDADNEYIANEVMVYKDGYSISNATAIEELDGIGLTNKSEAYRYGKYHLDQVFKRNETVSLNVLTQDVAVQRGDLVALAHPISVSGGSPFSVAGFESISGNSYRITTDRPTAGIIGHSITMSSKAQGKLFSGVVTSVQSFTGYEVFEATLAGSTPSIDIGAVGAVGVSSIENYLVKSTRISNQRGAYISQLELVPFEGAVNADSEVTQAKDLVELYKTSVNTVSYTTDIAYTSDAIGYKQLEFSITDTTGEIDYINVYYRTNYSSVDKLIGTTKSYYFLFDDQFSAQTLNGVYTFEPVSVKGVKGAHKEVLVDQANWVDTVPEPAISVTGSVTTNATFLKWVEPVDPSRVSWNIYRTTSSTFDQNELLATVPTGTSAKSVTATTGYFWAVAVNKSGALSTGNVPYNISAVPPAAEILIVDGGVPFTSLDGTYGLSNTTFKANYVGYSSPTFSWSVDVGSLSVSGDTAIYTPPAVTSGATSYTVSLSVSAGGVLRQTAQPKTFSITHTTTPTGGGGGSSTPAPTVVTGITYIDESVSVSPDPAITDIQFLSDGRASGISGWQQNWYSTTTANIGSSYWIKFTLLAGPDSLGNGTTNGTTGVWLSLASDKSIGVTKTSTGSANKTFLYQISSDSSGSNIVGTGQVIVTALVDM